MENGKSLHISIGKWIDEKMEEYAKEIVQIPENRTQYLELKNEVYISTATNNGCTSWEKITAVTKHLPIGNLIKIITRSGREVIATRQKSLLIWNSEREEFVETDGHQIRVGDFLPVVHNIGPPPILVEFVLLEHYLPKYEWIFGTDINNAYDEWNNFASRDNSVPRSKCKVPKGWWDKNNGVTFTVPFARCDSAIDSMRNLEFKHGIVYPKRSNRVVSLIPEKILLDKKFGFIVGIYLAEGWCTNTFI